MPATADQPAVPQQRRFTVDEYYRMADAGVFAPDDRIELLDGRIYAMSPISSEHAACVDRLNRLFVLRLGQEATVRVQNPIRLDQNSEPEPDISLLHPRDDDYASRHPQPGDIRLVIEVAETSLEFDRTVKGPLYAQAGIPAFWIANLEADRIEVYRSPGEDGYAEKRSYEHGQSISVQSLSALDSIAVDDVLGDEE